MSRWGAKRFGKRNRIFTQPPALPGGDFSIADLGLWIADLENEATFTIRNSDIRAFPGDVRHGMLYDWSIGIGFGYERSFMGASERA